MSSSNPGSGSPSQFPPIAPNGPARRGEGQRALPVGVRLSLREALVYGPEPGQAADSAENAPSERWMTPLRAGQAMRALGATERQQVVLLDLLTGLSLRGRGGTVSLQHGRMQHSLAAPRMDPASELARLESLADLRRARSAEILAQHEDALASFSSVLSLTPERTPATLALLQASWAFAGLVAQRAKVVLNTPRPCQLSPRVQPMISPPASGSCPGGHATQASLTAGLLYLVITQPGTGAHPWAASLKPMLDQLAARIAENREIAGLNFASDTASGKQLGERLLAALLEAKSQAPDPLHPAEGHAFAWLWAQAAAEWGN